MGKTKILFYSFNFILLISYSTINTYAQKIEEFKVIKTTSPKIVNPVFDFKGNIIGSCQLSQNFDKIEGISNPVHKAKIYLQDDKIVEINPIGNIVVCKEVNRIFTYGPFRLDHYADGYPKLLIYDLEGNLVLNYGTAINGEYQSAVSKNGNIYFIGQSTKSSSPKKVLIKINKNGIDEWERELPIATGYITLRISNTSKSIAVLRTNISFSNFPATNLTIFDNMGNITFTGTDSFWYNSITFLGDNKVFLTHRGNNGFGIKDIKGSNKKSIRRGVPMPDSPNKRIFIYPSPKGKYLGLLRRDDNSVFLYELGKNNNASIKKKIKLEGIKGQRLDRFRVKDNKTIEIRFNDQILILK